MLLVRPMFAVELEKRDPDAESPADTGVGTARRSPACLLEWHGLAPDRDSALRSAASAWEDRYGEPVTGCRAVVREIRGD
ncbi:MAG TPA: hypothetical protein VLZ06_08020 [Solirubrobacteraceae bacterium]|nr:hypothetical protein [Solirubrobacteraceae bacterium]